MKLYDSILDEKRLAILPKLRFAREQGFYLAGGTALALQIGHRDSIDFDFFCPTSFDTEELFTIIQVHFTPGTLVQVQNEKNTLEIIIDGAIRLSFMSYQYPLIVPLVETEFFDIAAIADIGCMKLSAITSRTAYKDYVDLYFILQSVSLVALIDSLKTKLPSLEPMLALKSLVYFDDIVHEEIIYKTEPISFGEIKIRLLDAVTHYNKQILITK